MDLLSGWIGYSIVFFTVLVLILSISYLAQGKKTLRTFDYNPLPDSLVENKVWYASVPTKKFDLLHWQPGLLALTKERLVLRDEKGGSLRTIALEVAEISNHPSTVMSGLCIKDSSSDTYITFYSSNLIAGRIESALTYLRWQKLLRPSPRFKGSSFAPIFDISVNIVPLVLLIGFLLYAYKTFL